MGPYLKEVDDDTSFRHGPILLRYAHENLMVLKRFGQKKNDFFKDITIYPALFVNSIIERNFNSERPFFNFVHY